MAKQRIIKTKYWSDPYIRKLDKDGKLLFVYLFTNDKTQISGGYEITLNDIALETGIDLTKIKQLLTKFQRDSKYIFKNNWMLALNFVKHQRPNPKVLKGIENALIDAPEWVKRYTTDRLSHLNLNLNPNSNLNLSHISEERETSQPDPAPEPRSPSPAPEPEEKPEKKSTRKKPPRDERLDHPAMKAVVEVMAQYPTKDLWNRIMRDIGETPDVAFMTACYETWRGFNGNKQNLEEWLFTPHKTGKLPTRFTEQRNGANQPANGKPTNLDRIESTKRVIDQYPTEEELRRQS